MLSPNSFSADASDLELRHWPETISTNVGNKQPFVRRTKKVSPEGEILYVRYWQNNGCATLVIFND